MLKKQLCALGAIILLGTIFAAGAAVPDKVQPDDKTMGNPKAPVVMIEYFSQGCSVCARFNQDIFARLKAKYIDTGKVLYVMRLYPLFPVDAPAYKLDLCVPPGKFFQATDLLFRNQPQWDDAEYPVTDRHGGLLQMAKLLGLSAKRADACMNSPAHDAAINKVAQDATDRYNPSGTPTFVINFRKVDLPHQSWDETQAAIDAALAAKHKK